MIMPARMLNLPSANAVPQQKNWSPSDLLLDRLPTKRQMKAERNAEIRERWADGEDGPRLARDYGMSRQNVYIICDGVERNCNLREQRNAAIRDRFANGDSLTKIAADYALTPPGVSYICRGVERKAVPRHAPWPQKQARNAQIRERWANGEKRADIAADYNLTPSAIDYICKEVERNVSVEPQQESKG